MTTETYVVTTSGKPVIKKDPNDTLDYTWDWTDWLDGVSDTIDSAQVLPESASITVDSTTVDGTSKKVTAFLTGGTVNNTYRVTCRVTTAGSRIADRSIWLKMRER